MIREGKAFMDDTPREVMQAERLALQESKYRETPPEVNLQRFAVMLGGGDEGSKWCLRMKMDMKARNPFHIPFAPPPHSRTHGV
jgi:glutamyl-tRNA synthetase